MRIQNILVCLSFLGLSTHALAAEKNPMANLTSDSFICWAYDQFNYVYPNEDERESFDTHAEAHRFSLRLCQRKSPNPGSCRVLSCDRF